MVDWPSEWAPLSQEISDKLSKLKMISKSRVYDYIALNNGFTNHFDRLDNNVIEKISFLNIS